MPSLRELQLAFTAAILAGDGESLCTASAAGASPAERLAIYRNNARHNFREALRAVYPVVDMLVGREFFDFAADRHAAVHPSTSGDIHAYGARFGDFLAEFDHAAGLPYLPDMARLEWAMHEAFHAADGEPIGLDGLVAGDVGSLCFGLSPDCRLLRSPYPVDRLWAMHQPGASWDDDFDLDGGGVSVLVRREGFEVVAERLTDPEFAMLSWLAAGDGLAAAYEAAVASDEGFDLGAFLVRFHPRLARSRGLL